MAEELDGSVKIGTSIDLSGAEKGMRQLRKDLVSATQQIAKSLDDMQKKSEENAEKTSSVYSGMIKKIAAAFSVAAIVKFGISSVKAYSESKRAADALAASLRNVGITTDAAMKDFQGFATEMQNFTGIADETILDCLRLATNFGIFGDKAKETVKAAHALSLGLGMDLQSAMMLLVKAAEGNTDMLGRYGLAITKTGDKAKDFDEVLRNVQNKFGDLAGANADNLLTKTSALKEAWGDIMEIIGGKIVPYLTDVLRTLNDIVDVINTKLSKNSEEQAKKTAGVWTTAWGSVKDVISRTLNFSSGNLTKAVSETVSREIKAAKEIVAAGQQTLSKQEAAELKAQIAAAEERKRQEELLAEQRKSVAEKLSTELTEIEKSSLNVQARQIQDFLQKRAADEKLYGEARIQFYRDEADRLIATGKYAPEQIKAIYQGLADTIADAAPTFADAWTQALQQMSDESIKTSEIIKMAMNSAMDGFEALGQALANGEDGFKAYAKASVLAIAEVVNALATQIQANAFAALIKDPPDYATFGQGMAAAAAMRVAAGVIKAMAGKFATGGIVPGNSRTGDNVLIRANSGELVLNEGQQGNLAQALMAADALLSKMVGFFSGNSSAGGSGNIEVNITNQTNADVSVTQSNVNNVRTLDIMVKQKVQEFLASPQGANTMSGLYGVGRKGVNNK